MAFKKGNRWLADYRDNSGKRIRKSFKSKPEAQAHEAQQLALRTLEAHGLKVSITVPKKPARSATPANSAARDRKVSR